MESRTYIDIGIKPARDMFYAHSAEGLDPSEWQTLREHLSAVGTLAGGLADHFGARELAEVTGLLHDLGKYCEPFQAKLEGRPIRVDHSTRGAQMVLERYGPIGHLLAYGIAGHHAGLADGAESVDSRAERTVLRTRLEQSDLPELSESWSREITLPAQLGMPQHFRKAREVGFQLSVLARMLFSCLVDADFLDTEEFYRRIESPRKNSPRERRVPSLEDLRIHLDARLKRFKADSEINRLRADILTHVRAGAELNPGLFSLTVPTGGGKTLASLAFALDHAIRHRLRRVIFVIPFTSIVEQTARVFRDALGDAGVDAVLEHHSAYNLPSVPRGDPDRYESAEKLRLAMENWDAPIIVTTAVQFFESLFGSRPSQCRKLHSIANSVVVLDEAQTLPIPLLRPCVAVIDELARNYRCSPVLCTATQPALLAPGFEGGFAPESVRELAPDPPRLYEKLRRVRVRHLGPLDDEQLVGHLRSREQVLCIVNNRRHARALSDAIADEPGACHLTTLMCARHRSVVLDQVRTDLARGRPCRLIATSLVEAGVDISFPTVLRAEAGLDSAAQAAGRCNRNLEWSPDDCELLLFSPTNSDWAPPALVAQFADAMRAVMRRHGGDLLAPSAIKSYFEEVYWQTGNQRLDKHNVLGRFKSIDNLSFETVSRLCRFIDDTQQTVIVPWDEEARSLLRDLRYADGCGGIARRLQRYVVQVPQRAFGSLRAAGAVQPVEPSCWGDQFMELVNLDLYDAKSGLWWSEPTFMNSVNCVL